MKTAKIAYQKTKEEIKEGRIRRLLLICILAALAILVEQLVYAKTSTTVNKVFDVIFTICTAVLMIEQLLRMIQLKTNENWKDYFKFQKFELLFWIAMLICLPISWLVPGARAFRWILLLKLPNVLGRYNDENVFQIIAKSIAVILILFFLVPFMNVIAVSFSAPGQIINVLPKNIDFFAIKYVLKDTSFLKSFLNSIFITVVGTAISVISMAMSAYPLSKPQMPLRKTMMMFYMIVMLFSGGIAPNILLVNALGLTDTIWALILPSVVMVYYLLLIKGFFESIPEELEESAKLDGASNFKILFKIIIPIASPMIATVTFFTAISYWNNINNSILYITSNQSIYPVPMYIKNFMGRDPMDIAQSMPELLRYWDNIEMGYILCSIVPIVCAYPLIFKYLKNDVSAGAVKG